MVSLVMDYPICPSQVVDDLTFYHSSRFSTWLGGGGLLGIFVDQCLSREIDSMIYKWNSLEILLERVSASASWPDFVK